MDVEMEFMQNRLNTNQNLIRETKAFLRGFKEGLGIIETIMTK